MAVVLDSPGATVNAPGLVGATHLIARREIRSALRMPDTLIVGLVVPTVILVIMLGMLAGFAASYGISNLAAFLLPTAVLLAVVLSSGGQSMVADIESGYFDKVLTTPISRWALLLGPLLAEFVRLFVQALVVLLVAVAVGANIATGVLGAIALVLTASLWGLTFSAMGFAVALKTGNGAATQSASLLWIPLLYLAPAFAPRESMAGWLGAVAAVNPVTYVVEAMRAIALQGWEPLPIAAGLLAVVVLAALSLTLAFRALSSRVS